MRCVFALMLAVPALAAVAEPRLEIALRQDRTVGVKLFVPPGDSRLDNAETHQAIIRAVGCLPSSSVRDHELQCALPGRALRDLVFHLRLRPRELQPHLESARALRIDVLHPAAARQDFPAGWTRESAQHHWIRYEANALPELAIIETSSMPLDLITAAPQVFLAALATLMWSILAPAGTWRYGGSVAGLAATLWLVSSSGMPMWITALPPDSNARSLAGVTAMGLGLVLLRFATRGIAHPASCRFKLADGTFLLRSAALLVLVLLVLYEVLPPLVGVLAPMFIVDRNLSLTDDEETAMWEWKKRHWACQLPVLMILVTFFRWGPPLSWPFTAAVTIGLGLFCWRFLPFRDAIIARQVDGKLGSPEPLAAVARKIQEQVFRW